MKFSVLRQGDKMMLDATAGNRMIWNKRNPPNVIFLDKELGLAVSPTIFADNRFCPFRDDVFECVIYDPPHKISRNPPPWWASPDEKRKKLGGNYSWYGFYRTKQEMLSSIFMAQREFQRLTKRLCFKWSDISLSLWKILPLFREWNIINKLKRKNKRGKIPHYWVTLVRSSASTTNDQEESMI